MSGLISEVGTTIGGILWFSLFLGVAFLFGLLGRTIRSGVERKSAVDAAVKQLRAQRKAVNEAAVKKMRQQGNSRIFMGILGIVLISFGILQFFSSSFGLLVESLFLVAVILGYFGVFFVPDGLGSD